MAVGESFVYNSQLRVCSPNVSSPVRQSVSVYQSVYQWYSQPLKQRILARAPCLHFTPKTKEVRKDKQVDLKD